MHDAAPVEPAPCVERAHTPTKNGDSASSVRHDVVLDVPFGCRNGIGCNYYLFAARSSSHIAVLIKRGRGLAGPAEAAAQGLLPLLTGRVLFVRERV